ncbi:MAG: COR domain-containing protein [Candidatus Electrothrix aestuarii]|uniref:non-specific serine/threonine protein kinase n=1 Tax=Candidatus Electrothrix aestuarii TaxID=3062594 RepID=A0AAU8LWV0_9BACT|nr:COR domain-containing protein [Candidatus Electrothrix aestuarii]
MGYEEALRLIEEENKRRTTVLNLSMQSLTEIPPELFQLTNLQVLNLGANQLVHLPPELFELIKLTELYLYGNQITHIPSTLSRLSRLTLLNLADNQFAELPPAIVQLTNLTELNLRTNQLVQLPSVISQLANLKKLNLESNQLGELPPVIAQLTELEILWLRGNPLTSPPPEIVKKGLPAIRAYFAAAQEDTRTVGQVKVILVGEGASGKTSLTRCLREEHFNPNEETTHGIRIKNWQLDTGDQELRCNLWDFGGQEIMHATHQFFLSRRSLYVLVLDGRRDERPEYWLRYIESFGGGSPVLVVLNKYDTNPGFDLDRPFLQEKYPFIAGFWRTSCAEGLGIPEFKQALLEELVNVPMVHTRWPGSWFRVKAEFEQMNEPCICYERFTGICRDAGVNEASKQDVLAEFLHDLGIVIHFSDFGLDDNHVLDPKWVTGAVYKIINAESVAADKGLLRLDALKEILRPQEDDPYIYRRADHRYIIELMKKFELCYELPGEEVLIPQLLAVPQPSFDFPYQGALRFVIHYTDFLPPSVMPRFIVKRHQEIKDKLRWRTGVVLAHPQLEATAVVRADNEARRIHIAVTGKERKVYLALIWLSLREINTGFEGLKVSERVPMPDDPKRSVPYKTLLTYREKGLEQYIPEDSEQVYRVQDLLAAVHPDNEQEGERMLAFAEGERKGGAMNKTGTALNTVFKLEPSIFGVGINLNAMFDVLLGRERK